MTGGNGQTEPAVPATEPPRCPRVAELERRHKEAIRILRMWGALSWSAALRVLETGEP